MNKLHFEIGQKWLTTDGSTAVITDIKHGETYPVHGSIGAVTGHKWTAQGKFYRDGAPCGNDLIAKVEDAPQLAASPILDELIMMANNIEQAALTATEIAKRHTESAASYAAEAEKYLQKAAEYRRLAEIVRTQ